MSTIPSNTSRLKPEIRLAQAVSQFEVDLSSEQKAAFRAHKSQSLRSPPTASDVMRLTAEIDRRVSGKAGGRCFGPRFINFLQAVQQYAALGEIVVGGSQNIIACGIWSLVRISLLSIVNFSSYLEMLSTLFMNIGRLAPRYQGMALLYPQSKSLRSYLSEYFIIVVGLCHQLLKFTQKSLLQQATSLRNDSIIKSFQSDLDFWSSLIKDEISLLMAKKIEEEAQEISKFKLNKLSKSKLHHQKIAAGLRVLDFCSNYDHQTTWKQVRKMGHTTLLGQDAEYQEWKDQPKSCTLMYTGKLGSGKSVLLANIVDDLHIHVQSNDIAVAYFFCRHDIPDSLNAQTIIGSLARQLLRTVPDLHMVADLCEDTKSVPDFQNILGLLCRACPHRKAYFILDGLDECHFSEREILAQQLGEIQEALTLLLCISFRVGINSTLEISPNRFTDTRVTSIPSNNPDIEIFINAELEHRLESRALVVGDPNLVLEIQETLLKGSQGSFLWVALQIQSLCLENTDVAIRQALADIPKDLSETFSRISLRSKTSENRYQRRLLELVTVAQRPLTVEELREALSVVPGYTVWNPGNLLNDIRSALALCGDLLIVNEESTIEFVHPSVKQFLLSSWQDSTNMAFTIDSAQRTMADIIVTYLSYDVSRTEQSTIRAPQIVVGSAPSKIIRSTLDSSSKVQSLALRLLKSRKASNIDINRTLAEARKPSLSHRADEFHFYSYAKLYWLQHILYFSDQELVMYDLIQRLCKTKAMDTIFSNEGSRKLLWWAFQNGRDAIVKLLLETGKVDSDSKDPQYGRTPLSWAAEDGREMVVELLLKAGKVEVDSKDSQGRTPLSWAAQNGRTDVVKLLLEKGADLETMDDDVGRTPLSWAAEGGHEAVVKLLLQKGANLKSNDKIYDQSQLLLAAEYGYEVVVELLLEKGADLESEDSGRTSLLCAARNGHEAVVGLLLQNGANLESKDKNYGQTPLSWAAENGHELVVELLL